MRTFIKNFPLFLSLLFLVNGTSFNGASGQQLLTLPARTGSELLSRLDWSRQPQFFEGKDQVESSFRDSSNQRRLFQDDDIETRRASTSEECEPEFENRLDNRRQIAEEERTDRVELSERRADQRDRREDDDSRETGRRVEDRQSRLREDLTNRMPFDDEGRRRVDDEKLNRKRFDLQRDETQRTDRRYSFRDFERRFSTEEGDHKERLERNRFEERSEELHKVRRENREMRRDDLRNEQMRQSEEGRLDSRREQEIKRSSSKDRQEREKALRREDRQEEKERLSERRAEDTRERRESLREEVLENGEERRSRTEEGERRQEDRRREEEEVSLQRREDRREVDDEGNSRQREKDVDGRRADERRVENVRQTEINARDVRADERFFLKSEQLSSSRRLSSFALDKLGMKSQESLVGDLLGNSVAIIVGFIVSYKFFKY